MTESISISICLDLDAKLFHSFQGFQCPRCTSTFLETDRFLSHLTDHDRDRDREPTLLSHPCNECVASFGSQEELAFHKITGNHLTDPDSVDPDLVDPGSADPGSVDPDEGSLQQVIKVLRSSVKHKRVVYYFFYCTEYFFGTFKMFCF